MIAIINSQNSFDVVDKTRLGRLFIGGVSFKASESVEIIKEFVR